LKVINVDFSAHVIELMRGLVTKQGSNYKTRYEVCDVCDLAPLFPTSTPAARCEQTEFDLIVDKGTLDALYCHSEAQRLVLSMISEVKRLLKRGGGVFVVISAWDDRDRLLLPLLSSSPSASSPSSLSAEVSDDSREILLVAKEKFDRKQPAHDAYAPEPSYHIFIFKRE